MTVTLAQRQLIKDAIAAQFGEEASEEMVDQVLEMPRIKVFTGALKAYQTNDGQRVFRCTASSTIQDLHGDFMTEECVRDMAAQAKRGPAGKGLTIFLNHKYNVPEDVAGKVIDTAILNREKDANGADIWDMDYNVLLRSQTQRIEELWTLIHDDEITLGISIGAYILEYDFVDKEEGFWGGLIINRTLLVETSIVGIPANQRSWIQNGVIAIGKSLGFEEKQIRRVLDGKEARPLMKTASTTTTADHLVISTSAPVDPDVQTTNNLLVIEQVETPEAPSADEAQEPAEAAPETESPAEPIEDTVETPDGETPEADVAPALADAAPEIALSLDTGSTPTVELVLAALEQATATLSVLRAEKANLQVKYDALVEERDQAVKDRNDAAEIIAIVARSPLGRKTQFQAPVQSFRARFGDIYDEAFLKLLETE